MYHIFPLITLFFPLFNPQTPSPVVPFYNYAMLLFFCLRSRFCLWVKKCNISIFVFLRLACLAQQDDLFRSGQFLLPSLHTTLPWCFCSNVASSRKPFLAFHSKQPPLLHLDFHRPVLLSLRALIVTWNFIFIIVVFKDITLEVAWQQGLAGSKYSEVRWRKKGSWEIALVFEFLIIYPRHS
jgi:hypothetical protein